MAEISYFQKYSQKENHITNNTMLMFRHVYRHAPLRFEKLLKEVISDASIDLGMVFSQQIRAHNSVPDALITQKPLSIYIEAKADGDLYPEQIQRHVDSVLQEKLPKGSSIIIGLTKKRPNQLVVKSFEDICNDKGINFAIITYSELLEILRKLFAEHEADLLEIVDDYETFLRSDGMLPNPLEMVVFPCGTSWDENIKYKIYYEQSSKPSKAHVPYIGIYNNKRITHVGNIVGTCICQSDGENLSFEKESGTVTQSNIEKINNMIEETDYYDLSKGFERYYIIGDLHEINIEKSSSGGIRGHRYFDLQKLAKDSIKPNDSLDQIVSKVKNGSFT